MNKLLGWKEVTAFVPTLTESNCLVFSFQSSVLNGLREKRKKQTTRKGAPEHLLMLTQHYAYYSSNPPTFCCPTLLPSSKRKIPNETKCQALRKQPSGTVQLRSFRPVLSALKKATLSFGQGLQGHLLYFWSFQKPLFKSPTAVQNQHQT